MFMDLGFWLSLQGVSSEKPAVVGTCGLTLNAIKDVRGSLIRGVPLVSPAYLFHDVAGGPMVRKRARDETLYPQNSSFPPMVFMIRTS